MSLKLTNIAHRFGAVEVLSGATLEAPAGEVVCLYGPSGCGKTTLLRIAAGLEPLQAGFVEINGEKVAEPGKEIRAEKRPVGFVFQDYVLFPHMSAAQNISFGLSGSKQSVQRKVADQLLAVGLEGFEKRFPHELSGGQQQRVAIARALAREPKALLLDEPFASIDTVLRRRLREDVRRLLKAGEISVILVTHDPEEALALADRIALMRDGRIIETASPEDLFSNPGTPEGAAIFPESQTIAGTALDGSIETPFGRLRAHKPADGQCVVVLRQSFLSVTPDQKGALRVVDHKFAGPGWAVFFKGEQDNQLLKVVMAEPADTGVSYNLNADPSGVLVFPRP